MSNTVASLIAKLQQLPQDLEVMVGTSESYRCSDPEVVTVCDTEIGLKDDGRGKREVVVILACLDE